jgi:RimJ/RimL family protein N-acetyltransferase
MNRTVATKDGRALSISRAEVGDAAQLVSYVERAASESDFLSFGRGEFGVSVAEEESFLARLSDGQRGFMLKGIVGGEIASVCTVTRSDRPRLRHDGTFGISVGRAFWGQGVGRAVSLAMLDVAREVGLTRVTLHVREDNAKARRLYESVGFVEEGVIRRGFKLGARYFDDILMGLCFD